MKYALAIDIGGTFTDAVLIRSDGNSWTDKTLTTHGNLLEGFLRAAEFVLKRADIAFEDVNDVVVHATTVVTNVLIERKGSLTGLIVTEGFKDVLYIRDEHRYDMFDPQIEYPEPLITREYTWGAKERIFSDTTIGVALDEANIREIARDMVAKKIVSVAVCLLNSYCNPDHERQVLRILNEEAPDIFVTLSSDVAPQMREYLRASTTAVNAYAVPITRPYLEALTKILKDFGVHNEPLIMLSNGGIIGARIAGTYPVRMIESGPAAGALVAGHIARKYGFENLVSFDMGGTTAKACMIQQGAPLVVGDFEVDRQYLFKPGSGMPVTVPSIDMIEIGAGGGSVARVDALGLLKVGPDSAGSDPGPACYNRGGEAACVTDADVILNILDPDNFLSGDMKLEAGRSEAAIKILADKLDLSVKETAWGIFSVVGESMAAAARAHATDRGINYRGLPLLAFGGAGPVHACYVAERLESTQVIYPPMASVLSAFGTLVTPARLDLVRGGLSHLSDLDWGSIAGTIDDMVNEGCAALREAGIAQDAIMYEFSADMRYSGQQNEVTILLDSDPRDTKNSDDFRTRFEKQYEILYGICLDDMNVEIVNWRVTAHGGSTSREVNIALPGKPASSKSRRNVFMEKGEIEVPVYDRKSLAAGQEIAGPVIIEERETTAFILPGWVMKVHADGSLIAAKDIQGGQ